jgi:hypothetical protein
VADPTQITITQTTPAKIVVNPAPVTIYGGSTTAATNSTIGGVIVGTGLTVQANGLLSANGTANLPFANLTSLPATLALHGITDGLTAANLTGYLLFSTANVTYSVLGHTHTIANVTGLQTALDGKQATGSYVLTSNSALTDARTPLAHNQAWSTITSTPTTLGGYGIIDSTVATLTGTQTLTNKTLGATSVNGTMSFLGNITSQLQLQSWRETFTSPTITSGTLTLDLSASNFFKVSLNAAITTITITNTPASSAASFTLEVTADGTARAVTWPAAFKWTGGTAPTLTSTSTKTDTFVFYSTDAGTTWRAYVAGQNQ